MKVLITAATKHGSTFEIASGIENVLNGVGIETVLTVPERVTDLAGYDAVILGSAVYAGHWLEPAKDFVARHLAALQTRPVWLFSSGPVADRSKPDDPADRRQGDEIAKTLAARDHHVFRGKIDKNGLSLAERAIVRIAKVPSEDQRDWDAIRTWAAGIATALDDACRTDV